VIHFIHTQCIYQTSCHFIQAPTATEAKYPVRTQRWLNSNRLYYQTLWLTTTLINRITSSSTFTDYVMTTWRLFHQAQLWIWASHRAADHTTQAEETLATVWASHSQWHYADRCWQRHGTEILQLYGASTIYVSRGEPDGELTDVVGDE